MDDITTIAAIKEPLDHFIKERGWKFKSRDLAVSISLEASELLEHYQWSEDGDGDAIEIRRELADVMIYCLEFAMLNGIDVSEAIREKMERNAEKYPVKLASKEEE